MWKRRSDGPPGNRRRGSRGPSRGRPPAVDDPFDPSCQEMRHIGRLYAEEERKLDRERRDGRGR